MTGYRNGLSDLAGTIPGWLRRNGDSAWHTRDSRFRPRIALLGGDKESGAGRRNLAVARALGHSHLKADVLLMGPPLASPHGDGFRTVALTEGDGETSIERAMRALRIFEPDAVIIDGFPLGREEEHEPLIQLLQHGDIRTILALADRPTHAIPERVQRLCDQIWLYADRRFHDFGRHCSFPEATRRKIRYTGHLGFWGLRDRRPETPPEVPILFLFMAGLENSVTLLETIIRTPLPTGSRALIALDPAIPPQLRSDVAQLIAAHPRLHLVAEGSDEAPLLAAARRIVAMGAHADLVDAMAAGKPVLLVSEHETLPHAFDRSGGRSLLLTSTEADPETIGRWLEAPARTDELPAIDFGALERLPALLGQLLTAERRKSDRSGSPLQETPS